MFGNPVVTVFDMTTGERHVYSRAVGGRVLTFRQAGSIMIVDRETGTTWNTSTGRGIAGSLAAVGLSEEAGASEQIFPYRGLGQDTNPVLGVWERFDAYWYLSIARFGYGSNPQDYNEPPFYPVLIRLAGGSMAAALLISNVALVGALVLIYRMTRDIFGEQPAARSVAYVLLFPTAFYLVGGYAESLFLLVALLSLRAMQTRRWLMAGFWTFVAILTRVHGIALVVPLLYALWSARPADKKVERIFSLALPALAGGVYLLVRASSGADSLFRLSETVPPARLAFPWESVWYAFQTIASGRFQNADLVNLLVTFSLVGALLAGWRKLPPLLLIYSVTALLLAMMRLVDTQPLNSMSRYALAIFPVFLLFGLWGENHLFRRAYMYPSLALGLFLSAQFLLWGWVG
jgi:hypothetical protein